MCIFIAVNLYFMHNKNASQWYDIEAEQLGRSLTSQAARLVASPLSQQDEELLKHYVNVVNQGMFVKGAVLFDVSGARFDDSEEKLSMVNLVRQTDVEPLVFVEDIIVDEQIIGYIKLILDKQAITQHHRNFNQNQFSQSILMIVLTIVAAALATRIFYKVRDKYRLHEDDDTLI